MQLTLALLANVLFGTTALAAPSGGLARRMMRRRAANATDLPSKPMKSATYSGAANVGNTSNVDYSYNWAGAVLESPPSGESFSAVSATFTVPTPSIPDGVSATDGEYAASAWVGIDGDTYQNAILQTGIDFVVTSSGEVSYDAWYEWYPDYAYDFDLSVSAGDVIEVSVTATSTTTGVALITDTTTGESATITLSSTYALAGENAEWIVEDFDENDEQVAFADFGTVTFTDAVATTSESTVDVSGATILDIISETTDEVLTEVTLVSDSEVTVTYV